MKKYIFPKDYPELDLKNMHIALYEASPKLLTGMSNFSSEKALSYLKKLGVEVYLNTSVTDYNGEELFLSDGTTIRSKTVVWSAGVIANTCKGIDPKNLANGNRIIVDRYNRIKGFDNIFVLGDQCYMETPLYPKGHPQVAQTAIQQALNLANNISRMASSKAMKEFEYKDKGSMATIGRNLAVADLPSIKLGGFIAWLLWSVVHLFTIVGIKNKLSTFLNWLWSYFTYDQSLRILIIPKKNSPKSDEDN
jgi:NADH dehydrogenase